MGVFDEFTVSPYTFLVLKQGGVDGNIIVSEHAATGIVKLRDGVEQTGYGETPGGSEVVNKSTLHIRADESFLDTIGRDLVGHGVRISKNGSDPLSYRIEGPVVEGFDFDEGILEFYKVTLKRESLATWGESDLPLS